MEEDLYKRPFEAKMEEDLQEGPFETEAEEDLSERPFAVAVVFHGSKVETINMVPLQTLPIPSCRNNANTIPVPLSGRLACWLWTTSQSWA